MASYAVVKFTDEEKTRIVSVTDIRHFDQGNLNIKKKYLVKYEEDGVFYPAQIILVKDSIEELEEYQKTKRVRAINKQLLESASETDFSDVDVETIPKKKNPSNLMHKTAASKLLEKKIMMECIDQNPKKKDVLDTEKVRQRDQSREKHHKEKQPKKKEDPPQKLQSDIKENAVLKQKIEDLQLENRQLLTLNMQLQKCIIDKFESVLSMREPKIVEEPKVGEFVKDQVYLGRGVYISKISFNEVWARATSGAQFVKNMAVALFGTETLLNSSVTGKTSNRIKQDLKKPPLDGTKLAALEDVYSYYLHKKEPQKDANKELKCLKRYVANKIADLLRTNKRHNQQEKEKDVIELNENNKDMQEEVNEDPVENVNEDLEEEVNEDPEEKVNEDLEEEVNEDLEEEVNEDPEKEVNEKN